MGACYYTPGFSVHIPQLCKNPTSLGVVELLRQEVFIGLCLFLPISVPSGLELFKHQSHVGSVGNGREQLCSPPCFVTLCERSATWALCLKLKVKQLSQRVPSAALAMSSSSLGWRHIWVTNIMMHGGLPSPFQLKLCAHKIKFAMP